MPHRGSRATQRSAPENADQKPMKGPKEKAKKTDRALHAEADR